jgi:hypothetical protein
MCKKMVLGREEEEQGDVFSCPLYVREKMTFLSISLYRNGKGLEANSHVDLLSPHGSVKVRLYSEGERQRSRN